MPKEGKNFYDFEKFPDKRFYGNIERAFGTLILNMLGGAVNDYANGVKMYRPDLSPVHTQGDCKTGFTIELEFIVVVECLNMNQDYSNLKKPWLQLVQMVGKLSRGIEYNALKSWHYKHTTPSSHDQVSEANRTRVRTNVRDKLC